MESKNFRKKKSRLEIKEMDSVEQEYFINQSDLCGGDYQQFEKDYKVIGKIEKEGYQGLFKAYDNKYNSFVEVKRKPFDLSKYEDERVKLLYELQTIQGLYKADEDLTNPYLILQCQRYYYRKIQDSFDNKISFELIYIYPQVESDLLTLLDENRKGKENLPEKKVIPFIYSILKALLKFRDEYGIKLGDLQPYNILLLDQFTYFLDEFSTIKLSLSEQVEEQMSYYKKSKKDKTKDILNTQDYCAPELKCFLKNKKQDDKKINEEKCSIFSVGVTALCLLFYDVKAKDITDLDKGKDAIDKHLLKVQNKDLKELFQNMLKWNSDERFSLEQSIVFYEQRFKNLEDQTFGRILKSILSKVKELNPQSLEQKSILLQKIRDQINYDDQDQFEQDGEEKNQKKQKKILYKEKSKQEVNLDVFPSEISMVSFQSEEDSNQSIQQFPINLRDSQLSAVQKKHHSDRIWDIDYSPHGLEFATCSQDKLIIIWDTQTQQVIQTISIHQGWVYKIRFTCNNKFLLSLSTDSKMCLLSQQEQRQFQKEDEFQDSNALYALCVSKKDFRKIYCSGYNYQFIYEFQITEQKKLRKVQNLETQHDEFIFCLELNQDETILASGSNDKQIILWDLKTNKQIKKIKFFQERIDDIKFSTDGETLFASSLDKSIKQINFLKQNVVQEMNQHTNCVSRIRLVQNENYLFSVSQDKQLICWAKNNNKNNQYQVDQKIIFAHSIWSMAIYDEIQMVCGLADGTIVVVKI